MATVRQRIILRKSRRKGERIPYRIKFDELQPKDALLVEIVLNRELDLANCYLFRPEHREKRRSVAFRVSGNTVYWLGGAMPKPLLRAQAEKLASPTKTKPQVLELSDSAPRAKVRKVLVFDDKGSLASICHTVEDVVKLTHLRKEAIDKLCKAKRSSFETGLSFRYLWKALDFDITDFSLTLSRYDELCKRTRKAKR